LTGTGRKPHQHLALRRAGEGFVFMLDVAAAVI